MPTKEQLQLTSFYSVQFIVDLVIDFESIKEGKN